MGWSLEDIALRVGVSVPYLKALEEDNHSLLPSQPYVCGFLKEYATFLGLDAREIISQFKKENKIFQQDHFQAQIVKENDLRKLCAKKIPLFDSSKIVIFLAILMIFFYLGFSVWQTLSRPKIKIFYPTNDLVTKSPLIEIRGEVNSPEASVFINGLMVDKIEAGRFSQTINLSPGLNEIKISAQKRRGGETVIWRRVILEKQDNF